MSPRVFFSVYRGRNYIPRGERADLPQSTFDPGFPAADHPDAASRHSATNSDVHPPPAERPLVVARGIRARVRTLFEKSTPRMTRELRRNMDDYLHPTRTPTRHLAFPRSSHLYPFDVVNSPSWGIENIIDAAVGDETVVEKLSKHVGHTDRLTALTFRGGSLKSPKLSPPSVTPDRFKCL